MSSMSNRSMARWRVPLQVLALYGAAVGACHADDYCTSEVVDAVQKQVQVTDFKGQVRNHEFWVRSNICYGDAQRWTEVSKGKELHLVQRATVYTHGNPAGAPKQPVVIWTHPNGGNDKFAYDWQNPNAANNPYASTQQLQSVLMPALEAGFTVVSLEFRHPVASLTAQNPAPVNTDIRDAIQYLRFHAGMLNIDPDNIFLVGQSRGSLNALWEMRPTTPDGGATGWRSAPWNVNAIWNVQAQTCYEKTTVGKLFIDDETKALFNADYPDLPVGSAGCAFTDAAVAGRLPPMRLMYEEAAPAGKQPWCKRSRSAKDCWLQYHDDAWLWNTYFDEHDANFGVQMKKAYNTAGKGGRFGLCTAVAVKVDDPKGSGTYYGYAGFTDYFKQFLTTGAGGSNPACPIVQHEPGL